MGRRWRNQRAAASLNRQAAASGSGHQQQNQSIKSSSTTTTATDPLASVQQARKSPVIMSNPVTSQRFASVQQQQAKGMQMYNLRPIGSIIETKGGVGSAITAASIITTTTSTTSTPSTIQAKVTNIRSFNSSPMSMQNQQLSGPSNQPAPQGSANKAQAAAADLVQSAAAKFKLLRSNTLAAASWISGNVNDSVGTNPNLQTGDNQQPSSLLALRTRDDKIVQTLSVGSSSRNRPI